MAAGATLAVGANVHVFFQPNQPFTDDGALTFATGDTVTFNNGADYGTTSLAVNGSLSATGTAFAAQYPGSWTTQILVGAGGELAASNSSFNLTQVSLNNSSILKGTDLTGDVFSTVLHVPYNDIQYLGGNKALGYVSINGGTLPSGTLNLDEIGTNTSGLFYAFDQGFTVAAGATLAVGANVHVFFQPNQPFTDDGALTFATGDTVTFNNGADYGTTSLAVNGSLSATGTAFAAQYPGSWTTQILVGAGGELDVQNSPINLTSLTLNSGSNDRLSTVVFSGKLNVNSGATISITGDDFSNVPAKGVVASGDANAKIQMVGNYWGSTVIATIESKIVNHVTNAALPTIVYQPFVSGASGTAAAPATATFSPTDQTINLSATVSTTAGVAINEGQETFTILQGTQIIGKTTAPANVSNGAVTATYTLPGNTPAGQYIIEASYTDSAGNYLPAIDTRHFLTVGPAATVTTTPNASKTFDGTKDQSIPLSAQVSSKAGTVDEGIVTFTILSGGNPVGSPVHANVTGDVANATYTLLAGTSGGSYTIQAVYTDPIDFTTSTGTNTLTVAGAATTITASDASATFDATAGEGITLSANVSSTAGTINQGAVTFKILDSSSNLVASTDVTVANGVASRNYILPAGTGVGTYTIQATYDGTPSFAASLPANSTLTISGSTTTTAASNASVAFDTAGETVTLTASVTSPGGTVSGGKVTFTVLERRRRPSARPRAETSPRAPPARPIRCPPARRSARTPSRPSTADPSASSARPTAATR